MTELAITIKVANLLISRCTIYYSYHTGLAIGKDKISPYIRFWFKPYRRGYRRWLELISGIALFILKSIAIIGPILDDRLKKKIPKP